MIYRRGFWWESEAEYSDAVSAETFADDEGDGRSSCPHCDDTAPHAYHRDRGTYCTKAPAQTTSATRAA